MMRPSDVPASFFVSEGQAAAAADAMPDSGGLISRVQLANFRQGGPWDVQRVDTDVRPTNTFIDYATVGIGLYGAAAGIPINEILGMQNAYAGARSSFGGVQMDQTYTNLPARNVYNTRLGYQLFQSGKIGP